VQPAARSRSFAGGAFVRARALSGFADVIARNGGDPDALLRQFGIDPSLLSDPENAVSLDAVAHMLEHAAAALRVPDLSLQIAAYHNASVLGAIALVALNSARVGEALDAIATNIRFHNPSARVRITADRRRGIACYEQDPGLAEDAPRRQVIEFVFAVAFKVLQAMTGEAATDWRVSFRHPRGMPPRRYRKYFACAIQFDAKRDCIEFPADLLDVPIDSADPGLKRLALRYLDQLERRHPSGLARRVSELIRRQLPNGGSRIERIAATLGMHPKTLHRRLKLEDTTFEQLLDDVRRALASDYLTSSALPFSDVATLVGYSGQSTFIVACKRWFGVTPKAYREGMLRRAAHKSGRGPVSASALSGGRPRTRDR
jgi:AraC-like DNA-binding protein